MLSITNTQLYHVKNYITTRAAVILCALLISSNGQAQKRNNIWAFGIKSGINFNTTPVSLFKSNVEEPSPPYFVSSICDVDGNLLFYTDGIKVWNRDNQLLPKYRNWWPWTNKVMPLISPYPANDSLYYLFGIDNGIHAGQLMYLTIKMKHAGDFDELVYPRPTNNTSFYTVLAQNASMALAGTTHCNGKDKWIVSHSAGRLESYLVTATGVSSTPVITSIPGNILPVKSLETKNSNLKFSANSERLIIPNFEDSNIVIFDFNNQTGQFSNPMVIAIPENNSLEDIDISPDGSKLYIGSYEVIDTENNIELHYIFQMDLDAGSPSQIEQTIFKLNDLGDRAACSPRGSCIYVKRTMQLGPNGKIYIGMKEYTSTNLDRALSVIDEPNKKGVNAMYRRNYADLQQQYKYINYNYIRSESFSLKENGIKFQKFTCADQPVQFGLLFNRVDSVKWDFGDAMSSNNFSTLLSPQHQYPAPGIYTAKAIIYNKCLTDTAVTTVTIQKDKSVKVPTHIKDTFICAGSQLTLDAKTQFANAYRWENGLIFSERTFDQPGQYQITVMNDCSIDRKQFNLTYQECECSVYIPTAFSPNNDGLNDVFKPLFKCHAKDYSFKIFNRYGNVVFQTNQLDKGWNGQIGSRQVPTGIYIWTLNYTNPNTNQHFLKNGTLLLMR